MTLVQAVRELNLNKYLGATWEVGEDESIGTRTDETVNLSPFATIAIAEAFRRGEKPPPDQPHIIGATLLKAQLDPSTGEPVPMITYSIQTSDVDSTVASRQLSYTVKPDGATDASPPTVVDLAIGISCSPLDEVVVTLTDTGTDGIPSQPSEPYSFTAAAEPLPAGPAKPTITGVTQTS